MRKLGHRVLPALVLLAVAGGLGGLNPASAAAGAGAELRVTVAHKNQYGQQAAGATGACGATGASGGTRYPPAPAGVDPFSCSSEKFDREGGFNAYEITVRNVGETPAEPVTVRDLIPEGLMLAGTSETGKWGSEAGEKAEVVSGPEWSCEVEKGADALRGPRAVRCTATAALPRCVVPECSPKPIALHVEVTPAAKEFVTNQVITSGDGAPPPEEDTAAIVSVPFGIASFTTTNFATSAEAESEEKPEELEPLKAGGHPFSLTTSFVTNYVPNFQGGGLAELGGGPKELVAELPPGLIGNPRNAGECPIRDLRPDEGLHRTCPGEDERNGIGSQPGQEGEAVGYVAISPGGPIAGGRAEPFEFEGEESNLTNSKLNSKLIDSAKKSSLIYNLTPTPGHPAQFGFFYLETVPFVLEAKLRSDGDYGITVADGAAGRPALAVRATFCGYGATSRVFEAGTKAEYSCTPPGPGAKPFLTNPTQCSENGSPYAPLTTLRADSWAEPGVPGEAEPGRYASSSSYTNAPSATPSYAHQSGTTGSPSRSSFITGCNQLSFNPQFSLEPTNTGVDQPTGLTSVLTIPQTNSARTLATPQLKNAVVELPEGLTISPTGAEGLGVCTNEQFGYGPTLLPAKDGRTRHGFGPGSNHEEPAEPGECPETSDVGAVEAYTPLLAPKQHQAHIAGEEGQLQGKVFVGKPECGEPEPCSAADVENGKLVRLFVELKDEAAGLIVKLVGRTSLNPLTGRLTVEFENQPRAPFEELKLNIEGTHGSLETPQSCGTTSLRADFTPWSAPETPDAIFEEPSFTVAGAGCGSPQPFAATQAGGFAPFKAGTRDATAATYSPFNLTLSREAGEQNIAGLQVTMPPGLTAKIAGQPECSEAQAESNSCPPETQIGTATAGVGPGSDPYFEQGQVFFTGPYRGAPFGLSIVIPAKAGPFNLGEVRVRQAITVNPKTTAATVVSDPFPQIYKGIQLRLRRISVELNGNFILNPTNCAQQAIAATLTSTQGATAQPAAPYNAAGCQNLTFRPALTAGTQAKTSKALGASLTVKVTAKPGEANIRKTELQLPSILPSRLTTLQKACIDSVFNVDPATCPEGSVIGQATVHTPLLSGPVTGPAILVSHGGAAFPDVVFVLQGQGIRLDLDGATDIKHQITYSKFESVPDQPVESFEAVLPEGPHSVLTANGNLCKAKLLMPTTITAQNGAVIKQNTKIAVSGCPKKTDPTRAQRLAAALKACHKKPKRQRSACEKRARRLYGTAARAKKAKRAAKAKKASVTARAASIQGSPPGSPSGAGASPALAGLAGATNAPGAAAKPALAGEPAVERCSPEEEELRSESDINPVTGRPYSNELPECRAYEMVSPVEQQGHNATALAEGFPVSPDGERVGFASEGDFAEPANFAIDGRTPVNTFISSRSETPGSCPPGSQSCWLTRSAFAPVDPISAPSLEGLLSDFSPAMSAEASCGRTVTHLSTRCAVRQGEGPWLSTPPYTSIAGTGDAGTQDYRGASAEFSRLFIQPEANLLPEDTAESNAKNFLTSGRGIYEIEDPTAGSPALRLVNVGNDTEKEGELNIGEQGPLLGNSRNPDVLGTAYHAVSEDGKTVFFTATPTAAQQSDLGAKTSEQQTVYARLRHGEGQAETAETLAVSNPTESQCGACNRSATAEPATFQGASADGSKVFFTTTQQLLNGDGTTNLYEYDFSANEREHLLLLSSDPAGAEVQGVVRSSSDGSHVYFVAQGVLTTKPNPVGQAAEKGANNLYAVDTDTREVKFVGQLCAPSANQAGTSGSVLDPQCPAKRSGVAPSKSETDEPLWGFGTGQPGEALCKNEEHPAEHNCDVSSRDAQTTPDGNYLVFSTYARLSDKEGLSEKEGPSEKEEPKWEHEEKERQKVTETEKKVTFPVQAVYRYSFAGGPREEGQLTWVSHEATGSKPGLNCTKPDECQNAVITPLNGQTLGATAGIGDWGRAVSGCPSGLSGEERERCPERKYDGEYVLFTTREKLQAGDLNEKNDVYLWHCSSPCQDPAQEGTVRMISDGQDPEGVDLEANGGAGSPGMSATGSDVFFTTRTQLVSQDQDELTHLYDARIDGGFPRPIATSSCSEAGDGCQPGSREQRELERVFGAPLPASLLFTGGANVSTVTKLTPSVTIHAAKLKGNRVVVTFACSEPGTVTLAGGDFKTVTKTLAGGANQLTVALSRAGNIDKRHHRKAQLEATLTVGENTASATIAVRL